MAFETPPLSSEDREIIERLAERVVTLHLEVPAILAIETGKPLSLLASQAMLFFEPMVQALFTVTRYRRFAVLVERRDALEALATAIDARAEAARERSGPPVPPRDAGGGPAPPGR